MGSVRTATLAGSETGTWGRLGPLAALGVRMDHDEAVDSTRAQIRPPACLLKGC